MHKEISVYDNTISARIFLGYIAEQAGGFASIGRDGRLYIKKIGENIANIPLKYFKNFVFGNKFKVTRIKYEDGIQNFEKGDTTENTIYINQNNMFIVDEEQIETIYNEYKNFECYSFKGFTIIDPAIDIGDILSVDGKKIIYQGNMVYSAKWKVNISSKIQSKTKEETTVRTISDKTRIRRAESRIDQAEGKIELLGKEQDDTQKKIASLILDINGIQTNVSKNFDFLGTVEGINQLEVEDGLKANILRLIINAEHRDIGYLYPGINLYPGANLYTSGPYSKITIAVDKNPRWNVSEKRKLYVIDTIEQLDSIVVNGEKICDQVLIEADEETGIGKVKIIRRIRDGQILEEEEITEIDDIEIELFEGTSYIYIEEYYNWFMYVEYLKNVELNKYYAKRVELNSKIQALADKITLEVSKKVDGNKIIASINLSPEEIQILAKKLRLEGFVSINGAFKIDKNGNMECTNGRFNGGQIILKYNQIDDLGLVSIENDDGKILGGFFRDGVRFKNDYGYANLDINDTDGGGLYVGQFIGEETMYSYLTGNGLTTPVVNQISLEKIKKNIKPIGNVLEIIKNSEIYEYNLKSEKDGTKKHIGFVIGKGYKTPDKVISSNGQAIDAYSMRSLNWRATQQLIELIEEMQKEIKELKEGKK